MAIFNSLGSNYDYLFVWRSLFAGADIKAPLKLIKLLEEKYSGKAVLVYKGREALRLALRDIALQENLGEKERKETFVGICGFTCYAVYEAVIKEGYAVEYLDIEEDTLHFSFVTFQKAVQKNPALKIVVIQNTLGFPCEIEKIDRFCCEKGIVLIEDLAHSIGAKYAEGRQAGTVGDFAALSFSQDKMVDGISGGALIVKNKELRIKNQNFFHLDLNKQRKDRWYPLFTYKIRILYKVGLGKVLHLILKKLDLLSKPMDNLNANVIYSLEPWYCQLILHEFGRLEENLRHRKNIAKIYAEKIDKRILSDHLCENISRSSNLRFPVFVKERQSLIAYLKENNIFVSDIWYDAPVAPKKYMHLTNYKGQCTHAEKVSESILNLPTHKNVSEKDAKFIAEKVNEWVIKNL